MSQFSKRTKAQATDTKNLEAKQKLANRTVISTVLASMLLTSINTTAYGQSSSTSGDVKTADQAEPASPSKTRNQIQAEALLQSGTRQAKSGHIAEADRDYASGLKLLNKYTGDEATTVAKLHVAIGTMYIEDVPEKQRHYDQAQGDFGRAIGCAKVAPNKDDDVLAAADFGYATCLYNQKQYSQALRYYKEAAQLRRPLKSGNLDDIVLARYRHGLGNCLWQLQKYDEALKYCQQAEEVMRKVANNSAECANFISDTGDCLYSLAKYKESEAQQQKAVQMLRQVLQDKYAPDVAADIRAIGYCEEGQNQYEAAEPYLREALGMRKNARTDVRDPAEIAAAKEDLAYCLYKERKFPESTALYKEAAAMRKSQDADVATITADEDKIAEIADILEVPEQTRREKEAAAARNDSEARTAMRNNATYPVFIFSLMGLVVLFISVIRWRDQNKDAAKI